MKKAQSTDGRNGQPLCQEASPSPHGDNGRFQCPVVPKEAFRKEGRDSHGRFAMGNPGESGNPFARRVAALRLALLAVVTEEDVQTVVRLVLKQARDGDLAAAKVLFAYVIGKPAESVDPDTLDLKEWLVYQQKPVRPENLSSILNSLPRDLACTIVRTTLPLVASQKAQELIATLDGKGNTEK